MSGLFEHLAATDDSEIIAHRKASAVAIKRVKDRFGSFLANATDADLPARLSLVEDDITQIVSDVSAEYGGDAQKIEAAIKRSLGPMPQQMGQPGQQMGMAPPGGQAGGALGTPVPAQGNQGSQGVCPHCSSPLVNGQCPACQSGAAGGVQQGQGQGGAYGLTHSMPQSPSTGPITAAGGFCDDCRKWKNGPNAGCTCSGDTQTDTHEPGEEEESEEREARVATPLSIDTEPVMHAEPLPNEPGKEGVTDIDGELAKAPSAVGKGASTKEAEALETVDLPTGDESALGGPSPKMDRANSGDEQGWSLDPIDAQMDGSPNPTEEQDVTTKPEYTKKDFTDQTHAVTKQKDIPKNTGDSGFTTERNIKQYPTKTFPDNGTKPVTRTPLSAVDPEKNPIREILDEYEGFLMPNQVESALQDWDG